MTITFKCHDCGERISIDAESIGEADGVLGIQYGWLHDYRYPINGYYRDYCPGCVVKRWGDRG